ncbi:MAG: LLM class flavin-dependent oxidoreductase, partial [Gammaproteobacteria bacterium]|nr:LLM class flavin-dependent oxidoreductase [Gammaproteobacteria bacterium]
GYLKQEFEALGINFEERGARTDEYIDAIRELWTSEQPAFAGQFVNYKGIQSRPLAYQNGGPPVIVGGTSKAAYRRAIQKGHGWYGFALDVTSSQESVEALKTFSESTDRSVDLGELEISITPRIPLTDEVIKQFEDMGVSRLILLQTGKNEDQMLKNIDQIAKDFF